MLKSFFLLLLLSFGANSYAQNPICPIGTYIADPTARVWPDGKLYIYGSTDESRSYYCSYKHDVLFTSNLQSWTMVNDIFSTKGEKDSLPNGDPLLYAPDIMYANGKYHLYFCTPDKRFAEGVATSNSPLGTFGNAKIIDVGKYKQIDPTVFIDDDGQGYYYWGQFTMKGAKLKANMVEIDTATIRDKLLTRQEHFFHEGSFIFKRKGIYYAVFADESRRDRRPTSLGYATSSSPLGPFIYKGVIIDNFGCDPESWNNHGSVAEFKGKWYVFYHRSSQGSKMMRRACVEPIKFNDDGSINEVEMTSQGAADPLSAFKTVEAERACLLSGYSRIMQINSTNEMISEIRHGDKAAFKYLDFKSGATRFYASVLAHTAGTIIIRDGSSTGKVLGRLAIKNDQKSSKGEFVEYQCKISITKGVKAIWLEFEGVQDKSNLFDLDWIKFK